MKTIIVPIDFSIESTAGYKLALMMAEKSGANIQMVNVILKNENSEADQLEKQHESVKRKFEEMLLKNKAKGKQNFSVGYTIKEGKIFREIADLGDSYDDALTVLSTHGETGFDELYIGGNAYKITSHSRNPVITVRRSKAVTNIDQIILPLDITFQTREKVPYTVELAKLFKSKIHIITVTTTNAKSIEEKLHQYADQVAKYVEYHKIPNSIHHLQGDNLTDITLDYARKVDADLISIMTEQEKSVSNLLLGSYAHQMINKAFIPVLSFPNYHLRITSDDIWTLGEFNARV